MVIFVSFWPFCVTLTTFSISLKAFLHLFVLCIGYFRSLYSSFCLFLMVYSCFASLCVFLYTKFTNNKINNELYLTHCQKNYLIVNWRTTPLTNLLLPFACALIRPTSRQMEPFSTFHSAKLTSTHCSICSSLLAIEMLTRRMRMMENTGTTTYKNTCNL